MTLPTHKDRTVMNKIIAGSVKCLFLTFGLVAICANAVHAANAKPETFASPEQAAVALAAAAHDNDAAAMLAIFGADGRQLVTSGDAIEDKETRARFSGRYDEAHKILRDAADKARLLVGSDEWPFPIPLERKGSVWQFDTRAGIEEILDRRVGRNELNAIEVCRSYVQAQRDYAADLSAEKKPAEYAQKFVSTAGMHDGLYWPAAPGEALSPIGPQMAHARAEGYAAQSESGGRVPYHGYFYKILTRQGASAPGGARDYLADGHMSGGFALVAFPATYGDSGVMTFVVNQDGIVFEKNLGPNTAALASAIAAFDPDRSWKTR